MGTTVTITRKVGATANTAWQAIAGVGGLEDWFPSISAGTVEGEGVGAVRRLTLEGGLGEMLDRILAIDHDQRRLTYRREESPFPVSSYVGTVEVFTSYDGRGVVAWTVDFESDPEVAEGVAAILEDAIGAGVAGLDVALSG